MSSGAYQIAERITRSGTLEQLKSQIQDVKIEIKTLSMSYNELREVETILNRTLNLLKRVCGGNEDLVEAIELFQKAILTIRALQLTIHAFEVASGPLGWILAGTSAAMFAFTSYDTLRGL